MSQATLLLLLQHGDLVWEVTLVVLAIVVVVRAVRRVRQKAAADAAERRRARLGTPVRTVAELREGPATVAGRLEAPGLDGEMAAADIAYARDGEWEPIATARAERLALVMGEERIAIEGPVEVVLGSRERPIARAPEALRAQLDGWKHRLAGLVTRMRTLAPGDDVWAEGVLSEDVADAGGAYRDRPVRRKLSPAEGGRFVLLAHAGAPRLRWRALLGWSAVHVGVAGLAFLAVFGGGGEIAFGWLDETIGDDALKRPQPESTAGPAIVATAFAAITPFRRERAIGLLRRAAYDVRGTDPALMRIRQGLLLDTPGCAGDSEVWTEVADLERSAEKAERCGHEARAALAWYLAGQFERGSRAWARGRKRSTTVPDNDWLLFGVRLHLLADRFELAASEARQLARGLRLEGVREAQAGHILDRQSDGRAFCVADAIAARRGDDAARHRLEEPPPDGARPVCILVLADLLEGRERLALFDARSLGELEGDSPIAHWRSLLEAEADPERHDATSAVLADPGLVFTDPAHLLGDGLPAVERVIAGLPSRSATQAHMAAASAAFAAVAGDAAAAGRFLEAAAAGRPGGEVATQRVRELAAAIALLQGDGAPPSALLDRARGPEPMSETLAALAEARGEGGDLDLEKSARAFGIHCGSCGHGLSEGVDTVVSHDGAQVALFLQMGPTLTGWRHELGRYRAARLSAPYLQSGRDELLDWVRHGRRGWPWAASPIATLVATMDLARAAQALGDRELAASYRARADRFYRALLRRDIAVPLAVLDRI